MLARVTGAKNGIIEYLENGMKSGRELSRDELDDRVCIDGNISLTDEIIKQLNREEKEKNYLHITLSFGERDLKEEDIIKAYTEYKHSIMNAYKTDEYNIYAEIHYPKIKSYKDKKTGELIERLPHVHIVVPNKNLATNKAFNPYGKYTDNIDYHDAIQETINRKLQLESPYDHQRKYNLMMNTADFISRYKGDSFKGVGADFKNELFDLIDAKNIRSMTDFETELSKHGEVTKGKLGDVDEYLKIKMPNSTKNIRLTETCFKPSYIQDRELLRPKPTDKKISALVRNWKGRISHEIKHIRSEGQKFRNEYYGLEPNQKKEFLHERIKQYNTTHNLAETGRATSIKPSTESIGLKQFAKIPNGLPSMSQRGLVRANGERPAESKSVLQSNANDHLELQRPRGNNELRRPIDRSGGRGAYRETKRGIGVSGIRGVTTDLSRGRLSNIETKQLKSSSLSEQLLNDHVSKVKQNKELEYFKVIRKTLEPDRLLNHFEASHGLVREHYKAIKMRDGSHRIKIGNRAFTLNDFCTQHMRLNWNETKEILSLHYKAQITQREEKKVINSISFASRYVTQGYTSQDRLARLNESILILKFLQRQEKQGNNMSLPDLEKYRKANGFAQDNTISNADLTLSSVADNLKRQQAIAKRLEEEFKISNLVANKDMKNKRIDFVDKSTGDKTFTDHGDKLIMSNRKPELSHIAAAMTLAAEKFGVVNITGTKEFKQQVIDIAVTKNLNLVFSNKAMNDQFLKQKTEYVVPKAGLRAKTQNASNESLSPDNVPKDGLRAKTRNAPLSEELVKEAKPSEAIEIPITLVKHGSAPYLNDKANSASYYAELSNGQVKWGIGLKDAIETSGAKIGDTVDVSQTGNKDVIVPVQIKDDQGVVVSTEQRDVKRNEWLVTVNEPQKLDKKTNRESVTELNKDKSYLMLGQGTKNTQKVKDPLKVDNNIFDVKYQWSAEDNKTIVTINGSKPSDIAPEKLAKIAAKDPFLKKFGVAAVASGKLDLSLSKGVQPIPAKYNGEGQAVAVKPDTVQGPKLK